MMNKFKLLAISCFITIPLTGCGSDDETKVFQPEGAVDYSAPEISITGGDEIEVTIFDTYTDAGATAVDNVDGDVTSAITSVSTVDTSVVGVYTVTYTVSDSVGNEAVAVRTVTVPDTVLPILTLNGTDMTIGQDTNYTDEGATATDNVDGDISSAITVVNTVDTSTVGVYTVTYNVTDAAGNVATEITRTVTVEEAVPDDIAPVIAIAEADVTIHQGTTFTDSGVTATDNVDEEAAITSAIVTTGTVDTNVIGVYTLTYNVTDVAGNEADEVKKTVRVIPVIDGVDIVADVFPKQEAQHVDFGSSIDGVVGQMFATGQGIKLVTHMVNKMRMEFIRIPVHATLPLTDPVYEQIKEVAVYAKEQGMSIMAVVSQKTGAWSEINTSLEGEAKYTAIAKCGDTCPDNIYGLDLNDYATYLDTLLTDLETAGAKVDYLAPFSQDDVSASDYQALWTAMSSDDDGTLKRVGPESGYITDADEIYTALAAELDVAAANFDDEDTLTSREQSAHWDAMYTAATNDSAPLWFTESSKWIDGGANANEKLVSGIGSLLAAINAGVERIIFERHAAIFGWFNGGNTDAKFHAMNNFSLSTAGNVVDSEVYSQDIRGTSFRDGDTLYVMFTNVSGESQHVAVRLQDGETTTVTDVAATDDVFTIQTFGVGGTNKTPANISVNDDKNIIQATILSGQYVRFTIPLTPSTDG
ncbi:DUF5011 domain-containing protein [Psychrosphaera sp. B3R10]|uniref:DUF5011 domain-containing protein n=1 Tax=unclassified Psychrosphaera TaxID=2641570 RepID=UPI001C089F46|nr:MULTISPECIES: DUF5011 domain-containing protein [unclassified Psychrosphaera]MBU2882060.1 DUF5011 domain-containing protein [Psychrosphaera sp. I2R16]MBU2990440.1 DUF5011 domain-containing protein [Psychrosphaera sp. B3R10]